MPAPKDFEQINASELKNKLIAAEQTINELNEENEKLRIIIDHFVGWRPFEIPDNVTQDEYNEINSDPNAILLSDETAKEIISSYFCFQPEYVKIIRSTPTYEINMFQQIRKTGDVLREPLFSNPECNYIRFDVGCMSYELYNGQLIVFTA